MKISKRFLVWSGLLELFASMRFAIALLILLAMSSVIGTVLPQNRSKADYVEAFGPFWAEMFGFLGLDDIYACGWFVGILFFLVLSTALCLLRNAPNFIREIKSFRLQACERSLRAMKYQLQLPQVLTEDEACDYFKQQGFSIRSVNREDGHILVAGKKGMLGRLGYMFTHGALILICLGGLVDSDVLLKMRLGMGAIKADPYANYEQEFKPESRLSTETLAFRSHVFVREGASVGVSFIDTPQGALLQELPFFISLKDFSVKYYDSGMARDYISTLLITDKASGKVTEHSLRVNHPVTVEGISIFQSDSVDGGSKLRFNAWNLNAGASKPYEMNAVSMNSFPLEIGQDKYTLEFDALTLVNVDSMDKQNVPSTDIKQVMQGAYSVKKDTRYRDAGPSILYRLRDQAGQGAEYIHYMQPQQLDGARFIVTGVQRQGAGEVLWLNLPLDKKGSLQTFFRLKDAFKNPILRQQALQKVIADKNNQIPEGIEPILDKVLAIFSQDGLLGVQQSIEKSSLQEDAKEPLYIAFQKTISLTARQLLEEIESRNDSADIQKESPRFAQHTINAISALSLEKAPIFLQLDKVESVNMSGLQLTRSPGKYMVYVGALLLVLGIYLMFYIQQKRVWLLLRGNTMLFALSSGRHGSWLEAEFKQHIAYFQARPEKQIINKDLK